MSSLLSGKKKSTTSSSSTTTPTYPDWLSEILQNTATSASDLASQEYSAYTGDRVAGLTEDEQAAFNMVRGLAGSTDEAYAQAQDITNQIANIGLNGYTTEQIQQYMNPYQEAVMDVSKRRQLEQFNTAKQDLATQQANIGAFGGSRAALAEQELYKNMSQQLADTEAQQLYAGYNTALNQAMQGTAQAGNAAAQMGSLATAGQQTGLQSASALQSAGQTQRALQQAGLDVNYQDYLTEQQYPYTQLSYLSGIVNPIAQLLQGQSSNSTSTSTSSSTPSILSSAIGLGSMLASGGTSSLFSNSFGSTAMQESFQSPILESAFSSGALQTGTTGTGWLNNNYSGMLTTGKKDGGLVTFADGGQVSFKDGDKISFNDIAPYLVLLEKLNSKSNTESSSTPMSLADTIPEDLMKYEQNDLVSLNAPELAKELAKGQTYLEATADLPASQKEYLDNLLKVWNSEGINTNLSSGYLCGGKVQKYAEGGLTTSKSRLGSIYRYLNPLFNPEGKAYQEEANLYSSLGSLLRPLAAADEYLTGEEGKSWNEAWQATAVNPKKEEKKTVKPEVDKKVNDILAQITPKKEVKQTNDITSEPTQSTPSTTEEKDNFNAPLFMFGATLLSSGGKNFFEALGDAGKAFATVKMTKEQAIREAAKEALEQKLAERRVAAYEKQTDLAAQAIPYKQEIQKLRIAKLQKDADKDPAIGRIVAKAAGEGMTPEEISNMVDVYKSSMGINLDPTYGVIPTGTPRTQPPALPKFLGYE